MPTAVAPSASALTTSTPERTPESNRTGIPSAAATTPGRKSIAGALRRLPAAVVGAVDAVDAVVPGAAHVVGVADSLEQQREIGQAAQPRQVVPGEARVAEAGRPRDGRGARVLLGCLLQPAAEDRVAEVVGQALAAGAAATTACCRSRGRQPSGPGVERDDDAGVPSRLRATDEALSQLAVVRRVELVEAGRVAELGRDVLHRVLHQGRDHRRVRRSRPPRARPRGRRAGSRA